MFSQEQSSSKLLILFLKKTAVKMTTFIQWVLILTQSARRRQGKYWWRWSFLLLKAKWIPVPLCYCCWKWVSVKKTSRPAKSHCVGSLVLVCRIVGWSRNNVQAKDTGQSNATQPQWPQADRGDWNRCITEGSQYCSPLDWQVCVVLKCYRMETGKCIKATSLDSALYPLIEKNILQSTANAKHWPLWGNCINRTVRHELWVRYHCTYCTRYLSAK